MSNADKRRIAYIISMAHGIDAWTFREIEALMADGANITLFSLRSVPGPYMPKADWNCYCYNLRSTLARQPLWLLRYPTTYIPLLLEAVQTHSLGDFPIAFDFAQQMAKWQAQLIHCVFGDHKFFIGYYCKKILKIPLSVALYGYDLRANPNWPMFRRAIQVADSIVVNCEFNRQLLTEIAGSEVGRRAVVVRHYAEIPANDRRDKVRILIVGGFVARKGHDLLFQAIRSLETEADKIEVWVAGYPGPVDVPQLARDLGVADKVRLFGSIADEGLDFLYQQCDIFCLPSKTVNGVNEGLPVAIIEAMAHGKPVIATRLAEPQSWSTKSLWRRMTWRVWRKPSGDLLMILN